MRTAINTLYTIGLVLVTFIVPASLIMASAGTDWSLIGLIFGIASFLLLGGYVAYTLYLGNLNS
ncbi:hypothetical protein L1765_00440 [Microaerobacter geothermalis]|nr:hypothetical protein [Microaerobacter geothermalis]